MIVPVARELLLRPAGYDNLAAFFVRLSPRKACVKIAPYRFAVFIIDLNGYIYVPEAIPLKCSMVSDMCIMERASADV